MAKIDEFYELLVSNQGFPVDDLNLFNSSTDEEKEASLINIKLKLNNLYHLINLSVLSGEYVNDVNKFIESIEKISVHISNLQTNLSEGIDEEQLRRQQLFNSTLKEAVVYLCSAYRYLLQAVENKYDYSNKKSLFNVLKESKLGFISSNTGNVYIKKSNNLFYLNVSISMCDLNYSLNENLISELIILKQRLYDLKFSDIISRVLIDKCSFLIRKIIYRQNESTEKSYLYSFDFKNIELDLESNNIEFFEKLEAYTLQHYDKSHDLNSVKRKKKTWEFLNDEVAGYRDFHLCLKHYKDDNENLYQVKNISKEFINKIDSEYKSESNFNKYAIIIDKQYFLNNVLSLSIDLNIQESEIFLLFDEILLFQANYNIQNYFPYIKVCQYLIKKIEEMLNVEEYEKIDKVNLDKLQEYLVKLKKYKKELYRSYQWCKENNFLTFQLPYEECLNKINIEQNDVDVFVFSSFLLPTDFHILYTDIKELSRKIDQLTTTTEVFKTINNDRKAIRRMRDELENSDKRSIEILGIFSAIVLFASGSIQIFEVEGLAITKAFQFVLLFAYSLILFVFAIWLITRENIKVITTTHKVFFVILAALTVIVYFIIKN